MAAWAEEGNSSPLSCSFAYLHIYFIYSLTCLLVYVKAEVHVAQAVPELIPSLRIIFISSFFHFVLVISRLTSLGHETQL